MATEQSVIEEEFEPIVDIVGSAVNGKPLGPITCAMCIWLSLNSSLPGPIKALLAAFVTSTARVRADDINRELN